MCVHAIMYLDEIVSFTMFLVLVSSNFTLHFTLSVPALLKTSFIVSTKDESFRTIAEDMFQTWLSLAASASLMMGQS